MLTWIFRSRLWVLRQLRTTKRKWFESKWSDVIDWKPTLVPRGTAVDLLFDLISSARFSRFVESTFTYIPLLIVPIIPLCLFQCVSIDRIFRRLVRQTKVRQCLLNAHGHSLVRQTKVRQCLLNAYGHSLVRQTKVRQCLLNAYGHSLVRQTKVRQCLLNAHGHSLVRQTKVRQCLLNAYTAIAWKQLTHLGFCRLQLSPFIFVLLSLLSFFFFFFFVLFCSFPLGGRREWGGCSTYWFSLAAFLFTKTKSGSKMTASVLNQNQKHVKG